uniref:Putative disease resistance RPP13-like protein 1 n=1 Tax=Davidia involucrata TaxID=16924 RepID=A0A5B7BNS6_DAVIN
MDVGEIILSAFITVLFEKLSSGELLKFARREGIDAQLKKWSKMLSKIQAVLSDAEDKQITDRFEENPQSRERERESDGTGDRRWGGPRQDQSDDGRWMISNSS